MKCWYRVIVTTGALLCFLEAGARAQTGSPPPTPQDQSSSAGPALQAEQAPSQTPSSQARQQQSEPGTTTIDHQKKKDLQNKSGTSNDRLFYTLPNFLTLENAGQLPPLTSGQKFKVVTRSSFDFVVYPWYGFLAGISQAENSDPEYKRGAIGYAKGYGSAFADGTIESYFTCAIAPSLLHQDPRFYQMGKGGAWRRTGYAVSRIVLTRGDSGDRQFNFSEVVGSAISSAISTYSYHPRQSKTLATAASVWGTQVGWDTVTYVAKEFWPDLRRKIHNESRQ